MKLPSSYPEFLETIQHHEIGEITDIINYALKFRGKMDNQLNFITNTLPAAYILDYTSGQYLFATNKITELINQSLSYFLDGGVDLAMSLFHREDLKVYSEKVMVNNLRFLKEQPVKKHPDYLFTCNYRIKIPRNGYINLVQQSVFIKSSQTQMPLVVYGTLFNISRYRNDSRIFHSIQETNRLHTSAAWNEPIVNNVYFASEEHTLLTRREVEVLKWICEELESEQIANKLNISKFTVDNHRRNMLQKTNCKSAIGLLKYAISHGLL